MAEKLLRGEDGRSKATRSTPAWRRCGLCGRRGLPLTDLRVSELERELVCLLCVEAYDLRKAAGLEP